MNNIAPIIITGGGQRFGFALAKSLHSEQTPVIVTYRTEREQLNSLRALGIVCIKADFASAEGIHTFSEYILHNYQALRAVIHNASDWLPENEHNRNADVMASMLQIHVQTPYQLNLAFEPLLKQYQLQTNIAADVIHLTDFVVDKGSKKHIAYAASKAALANLALSFSAKFAPLIKVNSIAPSLLMFNEDDSEEYRAKTLKKSLMQIAPGEIEGVKAVEYLLESTYVTGHTLHLNGGRNLI